jgi:hypothetical protein
MSSIGKRENNKTSGYTLKVLHISILVDIPSSISLLSTLCSPLLACMRPSAYSAPDSEKGEEDRPPVMVGIEVRMGRTWVSRGKRYFVYVFLYRQHT